MKLRRDLTLCILAVGLAAVLLERCSELPSLENRTTSTAFADTGKTRIGNAVAPLVEAHPGASGIYPLRDARDAFAARCLLAQAAERSLDVQYYIWNKDMTGTLLFEVLHEAADRGVRVRLLLDDNNTAGLDSTLAALDSHPKVEVRLFNPFVIRKPRIGYLTDFRRANRRMHNKSFTVDNQVTIIGGRNIGDEYFGATEGVLFADLDVIAVGAVVEDVSRDFDRYWASQSSYPADRLLPSGSPESIADLTEAAALIERNPAAAAYTEAVHESSFARDLIDGTLALEWAATRMVSDNPAKGLDRAAPETLITQKLRDILGEPASELDVVSPYFVPTAAGVELFTRMAERGVNIRVLVNSLEATDVPAVHAGYARRRKPLVDAGITLFELRRFLPRAPTGGLNPIQSAGTSLHAKTFAVDRSRVFIGSFNFDPRSAGLNTEMGFVIDSPALAQQVEAVFDDDVPPNAYEVRLSDTGELYWIERRDGKAVRYETEPGTSFGLRAFVWVMTLLPIESLL